MNSSELWASTLRNTTKYRQMRLSSRKIKLVPLCACQNMWGDMLRNLALWKLFFSFLFVFWGCFFFSKNLNGANTLLEDELQKRASKSDTHTHTGWDKPQPPFPALHSHALRFTADTQVKTRRRRRKKKKPNRARSETYNTSLSSCTNLKLFLAVRTFEEKTHTNNFKVALSSRASRAGSCCNRASV